MKTSWFIGLVMAFVLLTIVFGVAEQQYLGSAGLSRLETLFFANIGEATDFGGWVSLFISASWGWITNFWHMFWWNYAGLDGEWTIVKWVLLYPISLGIIASLVFARLGAGK
jgi:hypothetical protein